MLSKRYIWITAVLVLVFTALGINGLANQAAVQAQGTNLLINGSLEQPYYGQGSATRTVPNGWTLWVGEGAPDAFPHTDPVQIRDGQVSWNLKQGYVKFTAAAYQRVTGLTAGEAVKLTAYGWVYTCNDTTNSCIIAEAPYRKSDPTAGAQLKVGIDPTGGINPSASTVQWSAVSAPYDQWAEMSITAEVQGTEATVFLWMSQSTGLALNNVYWDQASLIRTNETPAQPVEPTAAFVPFVVPQNVRPDGSLVHTVQASDTLSSIAFAYTEYGVTIESIAELNESIRPNTRFLQIGQQILILPPGSIDPVTGELRPEGAAPPAPTATTPPADNSPAETPAAAETTPAETNPLPDGEAADATPVAAAPSGAESPSAPPPTYATLRAGYFPFENGYMLWLEDTRQIYVMQQEGEEPGGTFTTYQDTWREGMPENDPELVPPEGLMQPERNFGHAWRIYPGVRDALGWGTGSAVNYTALVVRDSGKVIVSGPDNRVYTLENGAWTITDLYPETPEN